MKPFALKALRKLAKTKVIETTDSKTKRPHIKYDIQDDGTSVGHSIVAPPYKNQGPPGEMMLMDFYIEPGHRREGLATKLMNHIKKENKGRRLAVKPQPYEVNGKKTPSKRIDELKNMYEHFGFKQSPTRDHLMIQKMGEGNA